MRLRPEQLGRHLQQQLLPVYVITGDEELLVQECCDQVRGAAREGGCGEREVHDAGLNGFSWQDLLAGAASMSLFAERRLVELRLPSGKPGKEGGKALCDYLALASGDDVLLLRAGRIDRQSTNSKWFKALDAAGAVVQVWPVRPDELPRWLQQRLGDAGLDIDREALALLCDRVEGNLLAAVQEVEKLKLLAEGSHVGVDTVTASVADSARFNLFDLPDAALRGDARGSLRLLQGLRATGTEPLTALWALEKDLRLLCAAREDCDRGAGAGQALSARGVWNSRLPQLQAALARHDEASLTDLLQQAVAVDGSIKGYADGRPWDRLERLVVDLCRG
jgi:DNA polymerase-3 subunit delta